MYQKKEYRKFLINNIAKALIYMVIIIVLFIIVKNQFGEEWESWLEPLRERPLVMFSIFFGSETIIGLLPPEFFIIWSLDDEVKKYLVYVILLTMISFTGGMINYALGRMVLKFRGFRRLFVRVLKKYTPLYQKWGGVIIIISAFTHLPFAAVSLVSGTMKFPFYKYILFASSRFLRFAIYAWIIWQVNIRSV